MKLSQVDENVLTTLFGKEVVDKLSGALKSDDGELSLGARINGRVVSHDEEINIKENAIQQGKELGYKDIAKGLSIDLASGEKDPSIIADKLRLSITDSLEDKYKNQQPGEREKELETKLNNATSKYDTLFNTHNDTLKIVDEKEKAFKGLETTIKVKERNNDILKFMPDKMKISKGDALTVFNTSFEFADQDGVQVVKKDGEVVRTGAGNPETYENIVKSFVEEKQWIKGAGMNGGDRGAQGSIKRGMSPEEAEKTIAESGKDPGSAEGIKMFLEMTKSE